MSWDDAQRFIKKLNEKEVGRGYLYRMPSEAEWEYACRAGATSLLECSYLFYFDKPTDDLSSAMANFNGNEPFGVGPPGPWLMRPTRVGAYPSNRLGLCDMSMEMCRNGPEQLRIAQAEWTGAAGLARQRPRFARLSEVAAASRRHARTWSSLPACPSSRPLARHQAASWLVAGRSFAIIAAETGSALEGSSGARLQEVDERGLIVGSELQVRGCHRFRIAMMPPNRRLQGWRAAASWKYGAESATPQRGGVFHSSGSG